MKNKLIPFIFGACLIVYGFYQYYQIQRWEYPLMGQWVQRYDILESNQWHADKAFTSLIVGAFFTSIYPRMKSNEK